MKIDILSKRAAQQRWPAMCKPKACALHFSAESTRYPKLNLDSLTIVRICVCLQDCAALHCYAPIMSSSMRPWKMRSSSLGNFVALKRPWDDINIHHTYSTSYIIHTSSIQIHHTSTYVIPWPTRLSTCQLTQSSLKNPLGLVGGKFQQKAFGRRWELSLWGFQGADSLDDLLDDLMTRN